MKGPTEKDAWQALDRKDHAVAAALWEQLIASCPNERERDSLLHGYGYALVGLKRFGEARAIYRRLYEKTGLHVYLHQLGMVAREAGEYSEAAGLFEQEHSMLVVGDELAMAANLYEQALVESLVGNRQSALELANRCLVGSLATEDKILHGCAYRLLGDLSRPDSEERARGFYRKARSAFEDAGDPIACGEIDERLATTG